MVIAGSIGASLLMGWLFAAFSLPVPWLLGPMLAGIIGALLLGKPYRIANGLKNTAQVVLGLASAAGFSLSALSSMYAYALPLAVVVILTVGLSLSMGYFLWRFAGVDWAAGFLGSLPGAAGAMVAMADDLRADGVTVAVLQYLRLTLVMLLAPLLVALLFPSPEGAVGAVPLGAGSVAAAALPWGLSLLLLSVIGGLGFWLARWMHLPSPAFLGSFLALVFVSWALPFSLNLPTPLFNGAMLILGLSVGLGFDPVTARRLVKAVVLETVLVILLIGVCLGVGYGFHLLTGVSTLTAVLGATPGGMDVMVASAAALGGDPTMVLTMQMSRFLLVLLAGPWLAGRLSRRAVG